MPRNWTQPEIEAAFNQALAAAVGDTALREKLLNPATANGALAAAGDITVPEGVEVIFYPQENLPLRLVMGMPALPENIGKPGMPAEAFRATFEDCFLCTYNTYESVDAEGHANLQAAVTAAAALDI